MSRRDRRWWGLCLLLVAPLPAHAATDLQAQTRQAITRAVGFLLKAQQANGAFHISLCRDHAMGECVSTSTITPETIEEFAEFRFIAPERSTVPTALVLAGLSAVEDPRIVAMIEHGVRFLQAQMDAKGFFSGAAPRSPSLGPQCPAEFPHLGLTALHRSVLEALGVSLSPLTSDLATYQASDGAFYSFAIPPQEIMAIASGGHAQERFVQRYGPAGPAMFAHVGVVDPVMNAWVFNYLTLHGHASPRLCDYLVQAVQEEQTHTTPLYVHSPYLLPHAISRAYAHGASCLEPAKTALQPRLLAQQQPNGSWGSVIDTALAASSLMQLGYTGTALDRAMRFLLDQQQADGHWQRAAWLATTFNSFWYGSEDVSTGLVLGALGQYLKI